MVLFPILVADLPFPFINSLFRKRGAALPVELHGLGIMRAASRAKQANLLLSHPADLLPFTNDHALLTESLGRAYYAAGDLENAQKEFEKIAGFSMGILYSGHIYAQSLSMLGRICDERGLKGKSRAYYQEFLDLWKDADHVWPEIEEARKRLASLSD